MRITLFGAGSQGDIQPCIRLGRGLRQAGLEVLLAAPQNFAGIAQAMGLPFHALRGDVQQIMSSETGQTLMESGGENLISSTLAMRKLLGPIAQHMAEDVLQACRHADALVTLAVFAPFGQTIAEICGIRLVLIEPTPVLPTGEFPAPGWPIQKNLGMWHNRLSGFAMLEVIWQWYRPFVNAFRQRFGLRTLTSADYYRTLTSVLLLGAYSPAVIRRPLSWPASMHITGYWFDDTQTAWQPPADLQAFLEQGEPPVYVGFGSMAGRDPRRFTEIVLEALARSGQRGILATGWGGLGALAAPGNIFVLKEAPHGWLFPRTSMVVHHGGAGTTAEALRAGKPAVIVPFIVDQLFWGKRVQSLGVGPEPIKAKRLTPVYLAQAINRVSNDAVMRGRAQALGSAIRTEDGLNRAVAIICQHLGT
jgi:sterol 3beta-glucosyltransferase